MIVTLAGNNSFALKSRLNQLVNEFKKTYGDLSIERFEGAETELAQMLDSIQNLPFLAERKLVILRDLSANKSAAEAIEQIIESSGGSADLILVETTPDKRTVFYKTLQKKTKLESFEEVDPRVLGKWLVEEAHKLGGELSQADANYLIDRTGGSQQALSQELAKLTMYSAKITRQTIDLLTEPTPQTKVFDLLDAAFAGQKARTLKLYEDQRAQSVEPQIILAMIAWQLRAIVAIKLAASRPVPSQLGLSPFVASKASGLAQKIPLDSLKELVTQALEIDYKSKSSSLDLDEALKNYLVTI